MPDPPTLTPNALESLLRGLDRDAFAAFVADLWAAGGWETEREDPVLVVSRGGETRRLLAWTDDRNRIERLLGVDPGDPDVGAVDAVVTRRRDEASARAIAAARDARVIDAAGLHDRLLYAIDRERGRELCRTHLGSDAVPRPSPEPERDAGVIGGALRSRTFLVAAALLALAVAVGVGISGQPPGEDPTESGTPVPETSGTPLITPVGAGEVTAGSPTPRATLIETPAQRTETDRIPPDLQPTAERFEALRANASAYRTASITCADTPGRLVEIAVGAIRFNDPARNEGLRTVRRLADVANVSFETFEDGITSPIYRPLFTFDRVALESSSAPNPAETPVVTSTIGLDVVVARDGAIARYEFRLRAFTDGCWKIDQIFRIPMADGGARFPPPTTETPTPAANRSSPGTVTDGTPSETPTRTGTPREEAAPDRAVIPRVT